MTIGHLAVWATNGVIKDGGDPSVSPLTGLCTTGGAVPLYNGVSGVWQCSTVLNAGSLINLNGGPLTIIPTVGTNTQGLNISQSGNTTSTSQWVPYNLVQVISPGLNLGSASLDAYGLNAQDSAFRVNLTTQGPSIHTALSGNILVNGTSNGPQVIGVFGSVYTTVTIVGNSGFYGVLGGIQVGPSGGVNYAYGVEADMGGNGAIAGRIGLSSNAQGSSVGSVIDAAISINVTSGNFVTGSPASWVHGLVFSSLTHGGMWPPLASNGIAIWSDAAFSTGSFADMSNVTFANYLLSFQNMAVAANGAAVFGAGVSALSTGPGVVFSTCTSCGEVQLVPTQNISSGGSGLQARDSSGTNFLTAGVLEANNAASTNFGQTGLWGKVLAFGSGNLGMLLGTNTNVPLIIGTNNTIWLTLSGGGIGTLSGPLVETINQNAGTLITINNNSTGASAFSSHTINNSAGSAGFGLGGVNYTGLASVAQNKTFVLAGTGLAAIALVNQGATPTQFYANGSQVGNLSSGGVFWPSTGYQINGASAASGHYLRGNGTNYVDGTVASADLPVASSSQLGVVEGDGATLSISGPGVISLNLAQSNTWTGAIVETINQNAATLITINNNSTGTAALATVSFVNSAGNGSVGVGGSGYTAVAGLQNRTYLFNSSGGSGIALHSAGANPIVFLVSASESGRWDGATVGQLDLGVAGATVGKAAFFNATSGSITLAPTTGALGSAVITMPATTGTMTILGNTTTGSGTTLVLSTSPVFVTQITAPIVYGGSAAGSTLTLNGTSSGSPSNAYLVLQSNGQFVGINNATPKAPLDVNVNTSQSPALINSFSVARFQQVDGTTGGFEVVSYGASAGIQNAMGAAGGTAASPTATPSSTNLFNFAGKGYNSGWQTGGIFTVVTDENWSSGHQGTRMDFYTTADASTTLSRNMILQASGGLSIGSATDPGTGGLFINGATITFNGLATDATHTDRTICQDTTSKSLFFGSGAAGICLGTSGAQFKNIVGPMEPMLDKLTRLELHDYYYRIGYGDDGAHLQRGPTAQDVALVFPDLVRYDKSGQAINYDWGTLVFIEARAIQELAELRPAIEKLKADNDNLRARLTQLEAANDNQPVMQKRAVNE